jgi:hypothetical protein
MLRFNRALCCGSRFVFVPGQHQKFTKADPLSDLRLLSLMWGRRYCFPNLNRQEGRRNYLPLFIQRAEVHLKGEDYKNCLPI